MLCEPSWRAASEEFAPSPKKTPHLTHLWHNAREFMEKLIRKKVKAKTRRFAPLAVKFVWKSNSQEKAKVNVFSGICGASRLRSALLLPTDHAP